MRSLSLSRVIYLLLTLLSVNAYVIFEHYPKLLVLLVPIFLLVNVLAGTLACGVSRLRLRICSHGGTLLWVFAASLIPSIVWHAVLAFFTLPDDYKSLLLSALWCVVASAIVFWNGIICVYLTSYQLGIRLRVLGALCGLIPVANLILLGRIISTVSEEIAFESEKERLNASRRAERICETRYPILLVHGVFFRDLRWFNYWGRIPRELAANGARIYYGEHQSALSVADSAAELAERIKEIVAESGCERVNVIAHSKGGLDCRYALSELGVSPYVASLITVNTPHRGCIFADRLLGVAPDSLKEQVAGAYNSALRRLGDKNPDFIAAVSDLTSEACEQLNSRLTLPEGIYTKSFGSILNRARDGRFPLNLSYSLVRHFDGANDGLVGEDSFAWGDNFEMIRSDGERGISHGDVIDLFRENLRDFDVREFYVQLVSDLRRRGL